MTQITHCLKCKMLLPDHAPDCPAAPRARRDMPRELAPIPQQRNPNNDDDEISNEDEFIRGAYLPNEGKIFIVKSWIRREVFDIETRAKKPRPCLLFTNGKVLVMGKTRLQEMAELFGNSKAASIGRAVRLSPVTISRKKSVTITGAPLNTDTGELVNDERPADGADA